MKLRRGGSVIALCALMGLSGCEQQAEETVTETDTTALDDVHDGTQDTAQDTEQDSDGVTGEDALADAAEIVEGPSWVWTEQSLGDRGEIFSAMSVSSTEGYATSGPRVLRYNGTSWAAYGEPNGAPVYGVTAVDGSVIAVGEAGLIARRSPDSFLWQIEDSGTDATLRAITHRSNGQLIAVGDSSTILHYDPETGWSEANSAGSVSLRSVWASAGGEGLDGVMAVGTKGSLYRYAGDSWVTEQIAAGDVVLHAVFGAGDVRFAVGSGGTISVKKNANASWQGATTNLKDPWDLRALAGTAEDDVKAFGDHGSIVGFDGEKWSVEYVAGPGNVTVDLSAGLVATTEDGVGLWMALAQDGDGLAFDGSNWVDVGTRPKAGLRAMAGSARDSLWACGPGGLIMTSAAQGWTSVASGTQEDLNDLVMGESGDLYFVGAAGTLIHMSDQGLATPIAVPAVSDLLSIGLDGSTAVMGGKGGTVLRGDLEEGTFSFWNTGMAWDVNSVVVDASGVWWLAGGFGSLRRSVDGETTEVVNAPVSGSLNDLVAWGDGVLVVGDNGAVIVATGDGASLATTEKPASFLYGAHAHGDVLWVVGYPGVALMQDTQGWTETDTESKVWLETVWSDDTGAIAGGRSGNLLQWTEVP
jgi:hypothetical protein